VYQEEKYCQKITNRKYRNYLSIIKNRVQIR